MSQFKGTKETLTASRLALHDLKKGVINESTIHVLETAISKAL